MIVPIDKQAHFFSGGFLAALAMPFGTMIALVVVLMAAVGKEVYDKMHPEAHTADVWDAVATMAGGVVIVTWISIF